MSGSLLETVPLALIVTLLAGSNRDCKARFQPVAAASPEYRQAAVQRRPVDQSAHALGSDRPNTRQSRHAITVAAILLLNVRIY